MLAGIGVDIEPVASFGSKPFAKNRRFYERVFSADEIAYCRKFKDPGSRFAARFCAKEALVKAARAHVAMHVTDAEVVNDVDGAPSFRPRTSRPEIRRFFRKFTPHLSLSHTDDLAIAFVVLEPKR